MILNKNVYVSRERKRKWISQTLTVEKSGQQPASKAGSPPPHYSVSPARSPGWFLGPTDFMKVIWYYFQDWVIKKVVDHFLWGNWLWSMLQAALWRSRRREELRHVFQPSRAFWWPQPWLSRTSQGMTRQHLPAKLLPDSWFLQATWEKLMFAV